MRTFFDTVIDSVLGSTVILCLIAAMVDPRAFANALLLTVAAVCVVAMTLIPSASERMNPP